MNTKKITLWGMLTALAFVLSYLETLLPVPLWIPGAKIGLANLVIITALYSLGEKDAFLLNLIRILLSSLTFGNFISFFMSISGGFLSFFTMVLAKRIKHLPFLAVSILGGISHNIGQIIAAVFVVKTVYVTAYLPILLLMGCLSGTLIGIIGNILQKRVTAIMKSLC